MLIFYDKACEEYETPGHPEAPFRTRETAKHLKLELPDLEWEQPKPATKEQVLLAHTPEHWERLAVAADFDADTAYHPGIREHALRATGAARAAADLALGGEPVFSLSRPPGHHAKADQAMGFCYLNHIAIAATYAVDNAGAEKVAVWDFDAHHGNGTEAILHGDDRLLFSSVHQYPGYPGTGTKSFDNIHNWIVPPGDHRQRHLEALEASFAKVVEFKPELILVSAGFDAYAGDPITQMGLLEEDFSTFGKWLVEAKIPFASVLEGGYSRDLPELVAAYVKPQLEAWKKPSFIQSLRSAE